MFLFYDPNSPFSGVSKVVELEKMLAAGGTPDDIRAKIAKPADSAVAVEAAAEAAPAAETA